MAEIYGGFGAGSLSSGDYDPGDLDEIDRQIRHLPIVVAKLQQKAQELVDQTASPNFGVTVQNDPQTRRPRAYAHPINGQGIHEELTESLLLKGAFSMQGR